MGNETKNYNDFLATVPEKLDINKTISLYELVKKYCPKTIEKTNIKLYGKNRSFLAKFKEPKWYTSILNYLVTKEVLITEKEDNGTIYQVKADYSKYFVHPVSTVYFLQNKKQHLILYKETSEKFLKETGLLTKEGKEPYEEKKEKKNNFSPAALKKIKWLSIGFLIYSSIQFFLLSSKIGGQNTLEVLANTVLFTIGILLLSSNK